MRLQRKQGFYEKYIKRVLDIVCSILFIIGFSWLYVIIAVVVKIKMGSPVIFKQPRPGIVKNGKETIFDMFKFRSMTDERDESGELLPDHHRLPKFGAFLRSTSLDELPQMFNVLNGTMAIIGPRPILDWEWDEYKDNKRFAKRYDVLPGFFCTIDLVNRAALREDQFEADAAYADNLSFWLDVKTFFSVIAPVLKGSHVYRDER